MAATARVVPTSYNVSLFSIAKLLKGDALIPKEKFNPFYYAARYRERVRLAFGSSVLAKRETLTH